VGQLAVVPEHRKEGIGEALLHHAIRLAQSISEYSACRIVYLYAYLDTVDYYKKRNFHGTNHLSPDKEKVAMFFDLIETGETLS
jgi:predicted N-acetyltransferase YhbS